MAKSFVKSKSAIPVVIEIIFLMGLGRRRGRKAVVVCRIPMRFVWREVWRVVRRGAREVSLVRRFCQDIFMGRVMGDG